MISVVRKANANEVDILHQILDMLTPLEPEMQRRLLQTVRTFLNVGEDYQGAGTAAPIVGLADEPRTEFRSDKTSSPKEFILQKQPRSDVERVACLAYYLTHYRGQPEFNTADISKLNAEAAQVKFSNAAFAVGNAVKSRYLIQGSRGIKSMSAAGEQFVLALPDRDAAKSAMGQYGRRPRRRSVKRKGR